ncbi:hypothetical protein G9A89_001640 [Geosiphon pyriformis]|nr:hypothetical protein G9A89_001640 [Geosiphon pyriformis]
MNRKTADFRTYAMMTLDGLLPVAERKKVYNSDYSSTRCLKISEVESSAVTIEIPELISHANVRSLGDVLTRDLGSALAFAKFCIH